MNSNTPLYFAEGSLAQGDYQVKEDEIVANIFFEAEEKIVEREVKRTLTPTPEEYAAPEQKNKEQALSRYKIKQSLLSKLGRKWGNLYRCPGCLKRKELELYRADKDGDYTLLCQDCIDKEKEKKKAEALNKEVELLNKEVEDSKQALDYESFEEPIFEPGGKKLLEKFLPRYSGRTVKDKCKDCGKESNDLLLVQVNKNGDSPRVGDYVPLCEDCFLKRNSKAKKWTHRAGAKTRNPWRKERKGYCKASFYNAIRQEVYKRDGHKCVFCEALGKAKRPGRIGLTCVRPESKGGKLEIDNYVCCCNSHRSSKSNKLPLEYIWKEINFHYWLNEQLPDHDVTATPGGTVTLSIHLVGGLHQFLARISANENIQREIRDKAERLAMRLSEGNDVRRDRKAKPLL